MVVETDGTLEQVDSLKTAYEGTAATGFDVFRNAFDDDTAGQLLQVLEPREVSRNPSEGAWRDGHAGPTVFRDGGPVLPGSSGSMTLWEGIP